MKKLYAILVFLAALLAWGPVFSQEVSRGYFAVNDCGTIFGPTPMRIVCLQLEDHAPSGRTKGNEYQFNASHVWVQYNGTGGGSSAASAVTFTPAGNISATNVQAAIQELDTEKLAVGGNAATATALAADGTNCTGVQAAQGVDAQGNAQGCFTPAGAGTITGVTAGTGLSGGGVSGTVTVNLATPVSIANGGTNATTAAVARTNLGLGTMATQDASSVAITGGSISGITFTGSVVGNASTATALAADPANCSSGQSPLGIDASGTAQGCFDVATQAELDAHANSNTAHNSTSANTASRIVQRDSSGNFAAGTITANFTGTLTGNAATATLATTATTAVGIRSVIVANLPVSPAPGELVRVTNALAAGGCEVAGGSFQTICGWNNFTNHWEPAGSGSGAGSLQSAWAGGRSISGAVDSATCLQIFGGGTQGWCFGVDSSETAFIKTILPSDWVAKIDATKVLRVQNSTGVDLATVDEVTGAVTIGPGSGVSGSVALHGSTSGAVTITAQPTVASYNFNLPSAEGVNGQQLVSQGSGSTPMGWRTDRRTCSIVVGSDNGSALANADLGPQGQQCFVPAAGTVLEITVRADAGTPNVIVRRDRLGTGVDLVSSALATAASGAQYCSRTTATTSLDGTTTCSATLQNTALLAGDWIGLISGTAGGTAKRMSIAVTWTVN